MPGMEYDDFNYTTKYTEMQEKISVATKCITKWIFEKWMHYSDIIEKN